MYVDRIVLFISILTFCSSCKKGDLIYNYAPTFIREDSILQDDSEYIIVIGDTQVYTSKPIYYSYYAATMDWIWSQVKHGKNIKCILHVGDVTENNFPHQYDIFFGVTYPTAELIPYIACLGNHDYDWDANNKILNRYSSHLSQYTSFQTTKSKVVARFEESYMDNIIVENYINGQRYDIISLEFGPRPDVVEWARCHVKSHADIKYILLTHEYLTSEGERILEESTAEHQFEDRPHTTPEQLWQSLIKNNDNIVCVICGHNGFSQHLFSVNSYNREVAQVLFNIQHQSNGGDGWIQFWEFPKNGSVAKVKTYNTIVHQENTECYFEFEYKY